MDYRWTCPPTPPGTPFLEHFVDKWFDAHPHPHLPSPAPVTGTAPVKKSARLVLRLKERQRLAAMAANARPDDDEDEWKPGEDDSPVPKKRATRRKKRKTVKKRPRRAANPPAEPPPAYRRVTPAGAIVAPVCGLYTLSLNSGQGPPQRSRWPSGHDYPISFLEKFREWKRHQDAIGAVLAPLSPPPPVEAPARPEPLPVATPPHVEASELVLPSPMHRPVEVSGPRLWLGVGRALQYEPRTLAVDPVAVRTVRVGTPMDEAASHSLGPST